MAESNPFSSVEKVPVPTLLYWRLEYAGQIYVVEMLRTVGGKEARGNRSGEHLAGGESADDVALANTAGVALVIGGTATGLATLGLSAGVRLLGQRDGGPGEGVLVATTGHTGARAEGEYKNQHRDEPDTAESFSQSDHGAMLTRRWNMSMSLRGPMTRSRRLVGIPTGGTEVPVDLIRRREQVAPLEVLLDGISFRC